MKSDPSFESLREVFRKAWSNQSEEVDGIEKNYISQLVRDTGMTRPTVVRAVEGIEDLGLGVSVHEEGKRKLNILVNPEFDES